MVLGELQIPRKLIRPIGKAIKHSLVKVNFGNKVINFPFKCRSETRRWFICNGFYYVMHYEPGRMLCTTSLGQIHVNMILQ